MKRLRGKIEADPRNPIRLVLELVGDAPLEADWVTAARAAGYLPSDRYFPHQAR